MIETSLMVYDYPDESEEIELENEEEKEYLEYEGYMDQCLEEELKNE